MSLQCLHIGFLCHCSTNLPKLSLIMVPLQSSTFKVYYCQLDSHLHSNLVNLKELLAMKQPSIKIISKGTREINLWMPGSKNKDSYSEHHYYVHYLLGGWIVSHCFALRVVVGPSFALVALPKQWYWFLEY